jgi:hypothetical protein
MTFDRRYQDQRDGSLKPEVRDRLNALRATGLTLAELGKMLGFSGPFISQMLNQTTPAHVRSIHVPRMIRALEEAEQKYMTSAAQQAASSEPKGGGSTKMSLEDHIRAIDALGFVVTVSLKQR